MKFGLKNETIQKICDVFTRYPQVEKAILYGSRAKGNFHNGSDIDLTLCGGPDLTFEVLQKMVIELDDLPIPYTIDLSILHDINNPDLVDHIRCVGVPFYNKL